MSVIAWSTLPGETIEKLIGIYICKKFTGATAVRPSQGDKGIDVRIDYRDGSLSVFQIKKFAQSLSSSHKRQIKSSWDALIQYIEDERKVLREWHLVMPLNPTNENITWLDELTADAECKVIWDGLTKVESWAAEMPEVAEYYLFDGKSQALENLERMASIVRGQSEENTDAITRSLKDICEFLDRIDPNYSYSLHVFSRHDTSGLDVNELCGIPGVVMSQEEFLPDGTRIRIDMLSKYPMATIIEPLTFNVALLADNEIQQNQIERFIELGTPLEGIPAQLKGMNRIVPFVEMEHDLTGELYVFPSDQPDSSLDICLSTGANGIVLLQKTFTRGVSGMRWEGCDSSSMFCVAIEAKIDGAWTFSLKFLSEEAVRPLNHEAQKLFAFLDSWRYLNEASLIIDGKHTANILFDAFSISQSFIDCGCELSNALAVIDSASFEDVRFPIMNTLSNRDVRNIKHNAELIENGVQELAFEELTFEYAQEYCPIDAPCILLVVQELKTKVGTEVYRCGYYEAVIPVGQAFKKESGETALVSVSDYGNTLIRRSVLVNSSDLGRVNQIIGRKISCPEDWFDFRREYLNQKPIESEEL